MPIVQTDRPRFYEQQYLGSRDLTAVVDYGRLASARHDLGAHIWGIAAGLQLLEKPAKTGIDVYVQPGYAWDGFGRPIVVLAPFKIPTELFRSIPYLAGDDANTPAGHMVDVWMSYTATPRGGPAYGFEACTVDDQYSRLFESFRIVIGDKPAHADRHDPITIGTKTDDAAKALQMVGSPTDPLLEDESVPHQTFPDNWDGATWLVPIGAVRWLPPKDALTPGGFVKREPADLVLSDRKRRYDGVVAETVNAARGFVRLRDRTKPYAPAVWSDDLVWAEGSVRVSGDVKLLKGQLILRDENNADAGRPLAVRRRQVNAMAPLGSDLFVQIGSAQAGSNRFVVGPVLPPANPNDPETFVEKLVVRDNGTVGIGTPTPAWPLTIRAQGGNEELMAFESGAGQVTWHVNQRFGGKSGLNFVETGVADGRLYVQAGGNVGIGTTDPKHRLEVHGEDNGIVLLSTGTAGIARNAGLELRTTAADGVSYIDFVKGSTDLAGSGTPDFSGRISYNEATTGAFVIRGGRLGLDTLTPSHLLHVSAASGLRQNRLYLSGGTATNDNWSSVSYNAHHDDANGAWVFPDPARKAVTIEMDDSNGVPRFQVYSTRTGDTQTWVQRLAVNGDTGDVALAHNGGKLSVGLAAATCRLHVADIIAGQETQIASHVALIENLAPSNGDVLALRIGGTEFQENNFITFFRGSNLAVGSIEGHPTVTGVVFNTSSADYAEWLPRADGESAMEPGEVVGVVAGRVSRRLDQAERVMVISTSPAVLGNMPARDERDRYERVAFVGQAPVKVRGRVAAGDYLVARDDSDGVALAVAPDDMALEDFARVVGVAWESGRGSGVQKIRAALGLPPTHAWLAVKALIAALGGGAVGAGRERSGSRRKEGER